MKAWVVDLLNKVVGIHDSDGPGGNPPTSYAVARAVFRFRVVVRNLLWSAVMMGLGVLSAGFGLKSFLLPNGFIDGGAVGISLLIAEISQQSLALLLILVNIPFIAIGYKVIGREFALKTAVGIAALSIAVAFIPYPDVTHDKLLVAVFGGFFLGLGIGLAVRGGGVIDGTEVLAIALSRKLGVTIGDVIMIINIVIFSVAAWMLSFEVALYSMLTYLSASKTVDFVIEGIEEYTGVTIVSVHDQEIHDMLIEKMGRGVTVYKGERGYGKRGHQLDTRIMYTVVTRLEVSRLSAEIEKIDPNAFVVMHSIKDTRGGIVKKRAHKH